MAGQVYLTPNRYRLGGYGIDASSFTAAQLRQKMAQATRAADAWCNRSLTPQRSDMRGGTITGEQHAWPLIEPFTMIPGGRRVYLNSGPIRTVESFALQFTNNWEVQLPSDNLFINATQGYIEIVATQPNVVGYPPLGMWFGLSEPVAIIGYTYGWRFEVEGDVLEAESPQLFYATNGNWLPGGDVTVTVDNIEIDPADYTVREDDGSVTFNDGEEPSVNSEVLANYTYTLPQQVPDAVGLIATDLMGSSAIARRGMIGLSSLKVAEVTLTQMQGSPSGQRVERNGISIPAAAAQLLAPFALGSIG